MQIFYKSYECTNQLLISNAYPFQLHLEGKRNKQLPRCDHESKEFVLVWGYQFIEIVLFITRH